MAGTNEAEGGDESRLGTTDRNILARVLDAGELDGATSRIEHVVGVRANEEAVLALVDADAEGLARTLLRTKERNVSWVPTARGIGRKRTSSTTCAWIASTTLVTASLSP